MRRCKSGYNVPAKRKKAYIWAEALTFLQYPTQKRNSPGNLKGDDLSEESDVTNEETTAEQEEARSSPTKTLSDIMPTHPVPAQKRATLNYKPSRRKNCKLSTFQSQLLKKLDASTNSEYDTDRMFLLSVMPDYKELDKDEKLDFKLMTLQFFRSVRQKKRAHAQIARGPRPDFSVQRNKQLRYNFSSSNLYRHPRSTRPPSTQSLPDYCMNPVALRPAVSTELQSSPQHSVFSDCSSTAEY